MRRNCQPIPGRQIDYVVYSSDFPWGIRIDEDIKKFKAALEKQEAGEKEEKPTAKPPIWTTYITPVASINGLTYLWEPVMTGNFYVHPQCNWYARTGAPEQANEPTLAFSSTTAYGPHGEAGTGPGRHYLLSMMLGVTAGRGNTRAEVLSYLKRSAAADGTHPRGTIYFVQNGDIRSKVRQAGFPDAVRKLKALGVAAEILEGTCRKEKTTFKGRCWAWQTSIGRPRGARSCPAPSASTSPASAATCTPRRRPDAAFRMAPLRGRGRQRHGDRTLRHPEQVSLAHDASALRPRLHGRRSRSTSRCCALINC